MCILFNPIPFLKAFFFCYFISILDSEDLSEEINNLKLITKQVSATLTNTNQASTTHPAANPSSLLPTDLELDEMSQETLTKLISRLESVANRLEAVQVSQPSKIQKLFLIFALI